jgi:hypothetical protein
MKEEHRFCAGLLLVLLMVLSCQLQAGIYKWYDDQGEVHYTQTPPPKGSRQARINADTFNTVKMEQTQANVTNSYKSKPLSKTRQISTRKIIRKSCPLRR